jgi:hypothetical protein
VAPQDQPDPQFAVRHLVGILTTGGSSASLVAYSEASRSSKRT